MILANKLYAVASTKPDLAKGIRSSEQKSFFAFLVIFYKATF